MHAYVIIRNQLWGDKLPALWGVASIMRFRKRRPSPRRRTLSPLRMYLLNLQPRLLDVACGCWFHILGSFDTCLGPACVDPWATLGISLHQLGNPFEMFEKSIILFCRSSRSVQVVFKITWLGKPKAHVHNPTSLAKGEFKMAALGWCVPWFLKLSITHTHTYIYIYYI